VILQLTEGIFDFADTVGQAPLQVHERYAPGVPIWGFVREFPIANGRAMPINERSADK